MATKISRLREEYEKRGRAWNGDVYDRAVSKYGSDLELDEQRPSETATLGLALAQSGGPPRLRMEDAFNFEDPFEGIHPAFRNFRDAILPGLTAGLIRGPAPEPAREGAGGLERGVTEKFAPMLGQVLGMGVTLPLLPAWSPAIAASGSGILGFLGRGALRAIPTAQRLGAYGAISGGAGGYREGGLDRAAMGALVGGLKDAATGAVIGGALPKFPAWLGGSAGHGATAMGGITAAHGGSLEEILAAAAAGAIGAKAGLPSWTDPRAERGGMTDSAPRQAEIGRAMMGEDPRIVRQIEQMYRARQAEIAAEEASAQRQAQQAVEADARSRRQEEMRGRITIPLTDYQRAALAVGAENMPIGKPEISPPTIQANAPATRTLPTGPEYVPPPREPIRPVAPEIPPKGPPKSALPEWLSQAGWSPTTEIMAQGGATSRNAPRPPSDIYLGSGLGAANEAVTKAIGSVKFERIPKEGSPPPLRGRPSPVAIIPNNQMDDAAQAYRRASRDGDPRAFQEYLDRIPTEGKVEPEFVQGLLKYEKAAKPEGEVSEVFAVPPEAGSGVVVEAKNSKARYYVDSGGQYWKLPADQPALEKGLSPPHRLMAGSGGGFLPDATGKRNPIVSRIYMPAEAVHDAEARAKETAIKAGQKAFDDNGVKSIADFERVGDAWLHLETAKELVADPAMLIATKPGLAEVVRGAKDPIGIVKAAQETRYMMDQLRENDNAVSRKMGLPEIGWVGAYRPKLEKFNLFQKEFGLTGAKGEEAIGLEQEPGGVPPWVRANSPANPRGMSRKPGLEYPEENRADILLANYIHNVIPHTFRRPMIRQARAYADVLDQIGLPGSAANIHDWTNKVLVGQESAFSRNLPALIKGPLRRQSALQSAAVLGSARFAVTQATGQVVAIGRHGVRNMVTGAARSMSDPKWRAWVGEEVVSMRNKRMPHGGASRQDLVDFTSKLKDRNSLREWMLSKVENTLSMWAAGSADARYRSMGGRPFSREAAQYISDEIKDVQGGYARSERAGLFRDPEFGIFLGKYQSYAAGVFSQARSLAAPGSKLGRTGYYKQEYAKSLDTESTKARRVVAAAKFVAAALAVDQAVGYTAWGVNSLLPWARHMGLDDRRAGAKDIPMLPAKWGNELYEATKYFVETGSGKKLRKWFLRWRVPAGIQIDYTVDGLVAWDRGGFYTKYQKDGKTVERKLFDVKDDEFWTVAIFGPYASEGGRKYLAGEKRTEPKSESRQSGVQYRTPSYRSPGR